MTNGILNSSMEPTARWESPEIDQEAVKMFLGERLRFPYASNVIAPNRMMKSAMSEQLATYDENDMTKSGIPTRELINLYEKFADGGFGTIVTGCIMINGKDIEAPGNVIIDKELDSDERRSAFQEWAQCTKRSGSIIIAQLFHPGKYAADLPHKTDFDINKLTRNQIGELINQYAYAASYAQQCGFNGVEISCAYFFALGQLITSGSNTRSDEFGGELDNRAKILFKIIQAIRMKISKPSRFVIGLKLFCGNFEPDYKEETFGEFIHNVEVTVSHNYRYVSASFLTSLELIALSFGLVTTAKTGFDYITVTGGHYNLIKDLKRGDDPKKCEYFYQKFVLTMKKHLTRTKLFMNGGFVTVGDMLAAVQNGWAAGISLARPVAAEPDLPKRLLAGEVKGATKSLFEPLDYAVEKEFAGSQLWQHGYLITVMDASNPDHVEQFKKDLHFHEKQRSQAAANGGDLVIGYPKTILHPELLDEDMLRRIQQSEAKTVSSEVITSDEQPPEPEAGVVPLTGKVDDAQNELVEEETIHVTKKQLDYGAACDLQENTVEDSIHTVVKRHENVDDVGVEIIEETIEKVVLTQSDFSEPPPSEPAEAPSQKQEVEDVGKGHDDDVDILNAAVKAVDSSFNDAKCALESAFEKGVKLVDEVVKDVTEALQKEDAQETNKETRHEEELPLSKEPETKEATEVISGLSDDDKPIISGVVEEVKDTGDESLKTVEQENPEDMTTGSEGEKHLMTANEDSVVGGEGNAVDENVVEEVMRKEICNVMTASFIEESRSPETELSPGKGDEKFTDASESQDGKDVITESTDQCKLPEDHFTGSVLETHAPEGVTEAYIPKDTAEEGHIPESKSEQISEKDDETHKLGGLSDSDQLCENVSNDIKNASLAGTTISGDVTAVGQIREDRTIEDIRDQHLEGFLPENGATQPGWDGLSSDADQCKVSSTTYSTTLFGSTLMDGGNGETVVYEEYYDKHTIPGQSPQETYHSKIYGIPSGDESMDIKSGEKQIEPEFESKKSFTDSITSAKGHGLTGFISSALPDSVQNLISSTRDKFDEMLSEGNGKQQPEMQFTVKTEEMIGDDGRKYEVHTENYTTTVTDHRLSSGFEDAKTFLTDDSDKFKIPDNDLAGGPAEIHRSSETTITTVTSHRSLCCLVLLRRDSYSGHLDLRILTGYRSGVVNRFIILELRIELKGK
uniref:NADH:flavin oxidoreductase/NADH oxidase N-terminal domain-containing protein n=1 Tax=Setaria digitata TaxID=48799 RepID=A0A915PGL1_9BILA